MNITKLKSSIEICLDKNLVPFIQGSPGLGKSAIVKKIAEEKHYELIDLRLSQCDITDLNGLPKLSGERAEFLPFNTFPLQGDLIPSGKHGWILFLDELNSANKAVQCASYKLILDRMVSSYHLHDNVRIVAAGNLVTDNAVVNQMSTALRSRLVNLVLDADHNAWIAWALNNNIDDRVTSYIQYKPANLFTFNPVKTDATYACPRTWEMVSKVIDGVDDLTEYDELLHGIIGSVSTEFITFSQTRKNLPSIESIMAGLAHVPGKIGDRWMVVFHIIQNIKELTSEQLIACVTFIKSMGAEYITIFAKQCCYNNDVKDIVLSNPKVMKEITGVL